jgi:hypothetical protein
MAFIFSNLLSFLFVGILTILIGLIVKILFSENIKFFKLIKEFRKKLPPKHKKAVIKEQAVLSHMQLDNLEYNITQADIDVFLKELETIEYGRIIFKKRCIEDYSRNIQRIIKSTKWDKFLIGILDVMLDEKKLNDRKLYLINKKVYNYIGL